MASPNIYTTALPEISLAKKSFKRIDFEDAYGCQFYSDRILSVDDTVLAFFKAPSPIITTLFTLRNKLMKPFGLKISDTTDQEQLLKQFKVEIGNCLGLFKVIDRSKSEVLLGEDDKHLNFRISFFLIQYAESSTNYTFTLSTTVLINNRIGQLYFFLIKPIHKFIVPSMMKRIIKQLSSN